MNPVTLLIATIQRFLPDVFLQMENSEDSRVQKFRVYPNRHVLPYVSLPLEIPASFNIMSDAQILDMLEPKIRYLKAAFFELEISDPLSPEDFEKEKTEEEKAEEKIEQSRISLVGAAPWLKI